MKKPLLALPFLLLSMPTQALAAGNAETKKACVTASTEGQTARDEGKLQTAKERLLACSQEQCPSVVRKSCEQWLADVNERIPSVVVRLQDADGNDITDVAGSLDGNPITFDGRPIVLDPGQHVAKLTTADGRKAEQKFLVAEREQSRLINVRLPAVQREPVTASASTTPEGKGFSPPTGAWILGGVGVVGLASFTYFGLKAKGDLNDLKGSCSPNCTSDQTSSGRNAATVADVSLAIGSAALIGAVVWTLLAPSQSEKQSASLGVVPTPNGAFATFRDSF
jgi:hypothetical protein